ncbi:recombinase family protein (plasmid) [Deinococcus wulumuqiensis]|uniref:Recombinase family protein n=1 Tax=Deinococcus wulumuqiensis TaxID=980427 RepID=A0A345IN09_9DEIO|nr:recombinase family protein [Deinococcus wulumuqiensis]AXH01082.1 recombinase family protein [Deinococcus wulumuqiensis]
MSRIGYVRVSSVGQNTARQLEGLELERVFTDKASGKDTHRPQLEQLLSYVREGDTVVVHSLDRLGRNLLDLQSLVQQLTGKGVTVEFIKEHMVFKPGEQDSMSTLLFSIMGAFAQFERDLIRERQLEGIAQAKKRGAYKGRKPKLIPVQVQELREAASKGTSKTLLAERFGISRKTVYELLKRSF